MHRRHLPGRKRRAGFVELVERLVGLRCEPGGSSRVNPSSTVSGTSFSALSDVSGNSSGPSSGPLDAGIDAGADAGLETPAAIPADLAATAASSTEINLTWTATSAGDTRVVGYTYAWADNAAFTGATYVFVAGGSTASATLVGLSAAITYSFKIKAEGDVDSHDSAYSPAITRATLADTASVPANLVAIAVSSSQIDLAWTHNSSGDSNVVGYTYAWAADSAFTGATYVYVAGRSTANASTTGLSAGTTYFFKIKAEGNTNPYDSAYSADVNTTTFLAVTSVPTNLLATPVSPNRIDLTWTANSSTNTAVIGYTYAFDTNGSFSSPTYVLVPGDTSASASEEGLTGLTPSTTYFFKIKAEGVTDVDDSGYSTPASGATLASTAAVPTELVATAASGSQIDLSWTANSSGDANVSGYTYRWADNSSFTGAVYVYVAGRATASATKSGLSSGVTYSFQIKPRAAPTPMIPPFRPPSSARRLQNVDDYNGESGICFDVSGTTTTLGAAGNIFSSASCVDGGVITVYRGGTCGAHADVSVTASANSINLSACTQ